jgi:poly(A) polymerase
MALVALADSWQRPRLPVDGADALKAGVPHGPEVGRVLGEVETWWISTGFSANRDAALAYMNDVVRRS